MKFPFIPKDVFVLIKEFTVPKSCKCGGLIAKPCALCKVNICANCSYKVWYFLKNKEPIVYHFCRYSRCRCPSLSL